MLQHPKQRPTTKLKLIAIKTAEVKAKELGYHKIAILINSKDIEQIWSQSKYGHKTQHRDPPWRCRDPFADLRQLHCPWLQFTIEAVLN